LCASQLSRNDPTNHFTVDSNLPKSGEGRQVDDGKQQDGAKDNKDEVHDNFEEDDSPWYLGKAKEDFHKRRNQLPLHRQEEEDPIQVCVLPRIVSFRN
jgi:SEL1 protein